MTMVMTKTTAKKWLKKSYPKSSTMATLQGAKPKTVAMALRMLMRMDTKTDALTDTGKTAGVLATTEGEAVVNSEESSEGMAVAEASSEVSLEDMVVEGDTTRIIITITEIADEMVTIQLDRMERGSRKMEREDSTRVRTEDGAEVVDSEEDQDTQTNKKTVSKRTTGRKGRIEDMETGTMGSIEVEEVSLEVEEGDSLEGSTEVALAKRHSSVTTTATRTKMTSKLLEETIITTSEVEVDMIETSKVGEEAREVEA